MIPDEQVVLITGGTGSFGRNLVSLMLQNYKPKKIIVFSRDEFKQHEMATSGFDDQCMRYFIGDIRDKDRLYRALDGVDVVVHAAALKQIPACEYNPIEAVKTNVLGAANLIDAAVERNVKRVLAISTDKAVAPVNLYGATKLCADKLFVAGNSYSGPHKTRFSVVRYGNVLGSRGSVIPMFRKMAESGVLLITDPRMTRFWLSLEQAARFVLKSLQRMQGGEIFVPKIPSMNIIDLAKAIGPHCSTTVIGIRPGEKLHEVLIPKDDARETIQYEDGFVVLSGFRQEKIERYLQMNGGRLCQEGFCYTSDNNDWWLSVEDLREMLGLDPKRTPASDRNANPNLA